MKKYNGYKSWTDYLENNPTEPNHYMDPYMLAICVESNKSRLPKETSIQFHQRVLGKQKFTWVGFERNYIWQFDDFLLFISKNKGRSIEMFCNLNQSRFEEPLNTYIKAVGIKLPLEQLHFSKYKFK